ncbi:TVP38/TMEM64 family protein [Rossellomorea marisflavi]|uniref:TVP38/TMEM64 family membrane protein n=2 Tax=Rossellomorea marisflavi TaxID=189381 RepID=A0A161TDG4_9BACI|nr:VTT domain-containing protein [Rossellomorea marisflavi]KZE48730.1 hypothetical protein AV649_19350 [Rossellomorea marisflavi]QHA35583.1 TVP38/TMEM64 family protein [Rossellomorea marisflavi]
MSRNVFILFFLTMLATLTFLQKDTIGLILSGDESSLSSLKESHGFSLYGLTLLVMIIQNSFTVIPLILVISLNVTLFGFWQGFLWSWISSIIGAGIVFISVRQLFLRSLSSRFPPSPYLKERGFTYVFQGRIIPMIPTSLVNITAGISGISFRHLITGTITGNFLYFFCLSLIPLGVLSMSWIETGMVTVVLIMIMIFYYKKVRGRR